MATNYKNSNYFYVTAAQTVPASSNKTGTVSTQGIAVIGTGTLFLSEMPAGSWLVDLTANELRRIDRVESDTLAYFKPNQSFTVDLSSITPNVIHESDTNVVTISIAIPGREVDGTVDGQTLPAGQSMTFSKDSRTTRGTGDYIDPIIVDAPVMLVLISK